MSILRNSKLRVMAVLLVSAALAGAWFLQPEPTQAQGIDPRVLEAEKQRVAVVEKVRPSVVAVFGPGGQGGGSGVLISKDGYALTNYHVVAGAGITMKCGLPDGILYDAVLVGLDRVGDVALIKLVAQKAGKDFPFTPLGDSDQVKAGDWSLAMGNPFLLATDFTPTVTFGLISGVHRYQYPEGKGLLEYTDCIQIDTSINPGNSGGPLFSMAGGVIGINGRGSFDKRGRINSGVGYAISSNQIKNFLPHMHAGLNTDHASLGAEVSTSREEEEIGGRLTILSILESSDAARRGLLIGDEVVEFAGRPMTSVNMFKNILGLFPRGWRVLLVYRRNNERRETLVRLMGALPKVLDEKGNPKNPDPKGPKGKAPPPSGPAAKFYEAKPGFTNYWFNRQHRDQMLAGFKKHGDFTGFTGEWVIEADAERPGRKPAPARITLREENDKDGKNPKTIVHLNLDGLDFKLEPLKIGQEVEELQQPKGSGGLLLALYHYRQLLSQGEKGFAGGAFHHGGQEPFYPPRADGSMPKSLRELRVAADTLLTEHAAVEGKWYFSPKDQNLVGFEITPERGEDPCEVYLFDYRQVDGRMLPHRLAIQYANDRFATLNIKSFKFGKGQ